MSTITTDILKMMTSDELEDYRSRGEDFRRELTHAVMQNFNVPEQWNINGEYRSEFGGFFPVQIRFTPLHGNFQIAICSPGKMSSDWSVLLIPASGCPLSVVSIMPSFRPTLINQMIRLVACLDTGGYSINYIIQTLGDTE